MGGGVPARLPGAAGAPPSPPPARPWRPGSRRSPPTGRRSRRQEPAPVRVRRLCGLSLPRWLLGSPEVGGRRLGLVGRCTGACPAGRSGKRRHLAASRFGSCSGAFAAPPALLANACPVKGPPRAWAPRPRGSLGEQGASERRAVTPDGRWFSLERGGSVLGRVRRSSDCVLSHGTLCHDGHILDLCGPVW